VVKRQARNDKIERSISEGNLSSVRLHPRNILVPFFDGSIPSHGHHLLCDIHSNYFLHFISYSTANWEILSVSLAVLRESTSSVLSQQQHQALERKKTKAAGRKGSKRSFVRSSRIEHRSFGWLVGQTQPEQALHVFLVFVWRSSGETLLQ